MSSLIPAYNRLSQPSEEDNEFLPSNPQSVIPQSSALHDPSLPIDINENPSFGVNMDSRQPSQHDVSGREEQENEFMMDENGLVAQISKAMHSEDGLQESVRKEQDRQDGENVLMGEESHSRLSSAKSEANRHQESEEEIRKSQFDNKSEEKEQMEVGLELGSEPSRQAAENIRAKSQHSVRTDSDRKPQSAKRDSQPQLESEGNQFMLNSGPREEEDSDPFAAADLSGQPSNQFNSNVSDNNLDEKVANKEEIFSENQFMPAEASHHGQPSGGNSSQSDPFAAVKGSDAEVIAGNSKGLEDHSVSKVIDSQHSLPPFAEQQSASQRIEQGSVQNEFIEGIETEHPVSQGQMNAQVQKIESVEISKGSEVSKAVPYLDNNLRDESLPGERSEFQEQRQATNIKQVNSEQIPEYSSGFVVIESTVQLYNNPGSNQFQEEQHSQALTSRVLEEQQPSGHMDNSQNLTQQLGSEAHDFRIENSSAAQAPQVQSLQSVEPQKSVQQQQVDLVKDSDITPKPEANSAVNQSSQTHLEPDQASPIPEPQIQKQSQQEQPQIKQTLLKEQQSDHLESHLQQEQAKIEQPERNSQSRHSAASGSNKEPNQPQFQQRQSIEEVQVIQRSQKEASSDKLSQKNEPQIQEQLPPQQPMTFNLKQEPSLADHLQDSNKNSTDRLKSFEEGLQKQIKKEESMLRPQLRTVREEEFQLDNYSMPVTMEHPSSPSKQAEETPKSKSALGGSQKSSSMASQINPSKSPSMVSNSSSHKSPSQLDKGSFVSKSSSIKSSRRSQVSSKISARRKTNANTQVLTRAPARSVADITSHLESSALSRNHHKQQASQQQTNSGIFKRRQTQKRQDIFNTFPEIDQRKAAVAVEEPSNVPDVRGALSPIQETQSEQIRQKMLSVPSGEKLKKQKIRDERKQEQMERIRLLKQAQKKRLQKELEKVKKELQDLEHRQKNADKQMQRSHHARHKRQSQQVLMMVKEHKHRQNSSSDIKDIEQNLMDNLAELTKMRRQNQEKKKDAKRQEIADRMRRNEARRVEEQKMMKVNRHYVEQFKSAEPLAPPKSPKSPARAKAVLPESQSRREIQGSRLGKFRSLGKKKTSSDVYETRLG